MYASRTVFVLLCCLIAFGDGPTFAQKPRSAVSSTSSSSRDKSSIASHPKSAQPGLKCYPSKSRELDLLRELNIRAMRPSRRKARVYFPKSRRSSSLGAFLGGRAGYIHIVSLYCPPCNAEWPHVVEAIPKLRERGLVLKVVGLAPKSEALALVQHFSRIRPLPNAIRIAVSTDDALLDAFGLKPSAPQTLLVDGRLELVGRPIYGSTDIWSRPVRAFQNRLKPKPSRPRRRARRR